FCPPRRRESQSAWNEQPLTGHEGVRPQVVPLLDLPYRGARVASVSPLGDRPERVTRLYDVDALPPRTLGRASDDAPDHEGCDGDEEHFPEHVFAFYSEQTFASRTGKYPFSVAGGYVA